MTFDGSQADYFGPAIEQEPGSATIILSDDVHGSGAEFFSTFTCLFRSSNTCSLCFLSSNANTLCLCLSLSLCLCRHVSVGEHAACATVLDGAGAGQYRRVVGWTKGEKNPDKTINCDSLLVPIKPSNDSAARHRQHQAGLVLLVASAMQGEGAYVLSNIEGEESVSAPAEALPTLSEGTASVAGT